MSVGVAPLARGCTRDSNVFVAAAGAAGEIVVVDRAALDRRTVGFRANTLVALIIVLNTAELALDLIRIENIVNVKYTP